MTIAPIPNRWKEPVLKALKAQDPSNISWTFRSQSDWSLFGTPDDAYELLQKTLSSSVIGQDRSLQMHDAEETWAFLCDHPHNPETKLYAKIGLLENHVSIRVFSLHADLQDGKLEELINKYLSKKFLNKRKK